jgi:hypothetical protein
MMLIAPPASHPNRGMGASPMQLAAQPLSEGAATAAERMGEAPMPREDA